MNGTRQPIAKNRLLVPHKMDKINSHSDGEILLSPKTRRRINSVEKSPNHVNLSFSHDNLPFSGIPPVRPNIEITAFSGRKSPKQWRESIPPHLSSSSSTSALHNTVDRHFNPISNPHITRKIPCDRRMASFSSKKTKTPINGIIPSIQIQNLQSFSSTDLG